MILIKKRHLIIPKLKSVLKKRLGFYFDYKLKQEIKRVRKTQNELVKQLKEKEKINIIFLAIFDSVWKYEEVYRLFDKDSKFNVAVVVIPHIVEDKIQWETFNNTLNFFKKNEYHTISSYDKKDKEWIDIKQVVQPDIVFFTLPYEYTLKKYTINNFLDKLTCYVPYNYGNSHLLQMMHNQRFHNLLSYYFVETDIHKGFSEQIALNKGVNIITTGYPGTDVFLKDDYTPKNNWKIKDKGIKRIIWAPHHTIDDNKTHLSYSSFLSLYQVMTNLLKEFDTIQVAFKPHPLLKQKLYSHEKWGEERTDKYYDTWNSFSNGQLEEGNYIDLFLTSDGMIHDSGSFLIEYLYTSKPVLHTNRDKDIMDRLNSFGKMAFDVHYHAKSPKDIYEFIEKIILNGDDLMKVKREYFKNNYLLPPNNVSASQNIYQNLKNQLKYTS